jgi:outer membrane protein assembly factor BamB
MPSSHRRFTDVATSLVTVRRLAALGLLVALAGCKDDPEEVTPPEALTEWTQVGGSAAHRGAIDVVAQPPARILADVVYDPFVGEETDPLTTDGTLLIHYQAPLVVGDDVYVQRKSGAFTPCQSSPSSCTAQDYESQVWNESHYKWVNGSLVHQWDYPSDWKPALGVGFEQMFHAAVFGDVLYVPGAGGTLHKVDRRTGQRLALIRPLAAEPNTTLHVAGPPTVDADGDVFYNVIQLDQDLPFVVDAKGWLVKVSPSDETRTATYASLALGAKAPDELCFYAFSSSAPRPLPPPPNADGSPAAPPEGPCFSQRPGINVAPAVGTDGTVYTVSRAHRNPRYSYLLAVNADLKPRWAQSFRDLFDDGCGVLVSCRDGATRGVDPSTNQRPAGQVNDSATSSPVVLPDGDILYGTWSGYNGSRGHLVKLDRKTGAVKGSFGFGWDITPAVWAHDDTYSILLKENHYAALPEDERFYITQLNADLGVEWQFLATNDQVCERDAGGQVTCHTESANGQEWCINAPAVDKEGTVHVASEDGHLYQIGQSGVQKGRVFMQKALRSGYTPVVLDAQGRIYAMNAGHLFVFGQ